MTGVGVVSITASQSGNASFDPAIPITHSFTVVNAERPMSTPITRNGTAAAPGPVPTNEKVWYDVDGDGILDEIIPANTLGFHYEIIATGTTNPGIEWVDVPVLFRDGDYGPIWNFVARSTAPEDVFVTQHFAFDDPDPNYEYMIYGALPGRDDRLQDWRLGSRMRYTANGIRSGAWEMDQPLSSIVSVSIYLIRFGKRPDNPDWSLAGIAADPDPIRYYMADRTQFLNIVPDWKWDDIISNRYWNAETSITTADAIAAWRLGTEAAAVMAPDAPPLAPDTPVDVEPIGITLSALRGNALLALVIFTEVVQKIPLSYVCYEKPHKFIAGKWYSGRTGPAIGDPEAVLRKRDLWHERNIDHWGAQLRAYIITQGFVTRAEYAQRGREQQMIDSHGGFKPAVNGTPAYVLGLTDSTNDRREIAADAIDSKIYWTTATFCHGYLAPYTGDDKWYMPNYVVPLWPSGGNIIKVAPPAALYPFAPVISRHYAFRSCTSLNEGYS